MEIELFDYLKLFEMYNDLEKKEPVIKGFEIKWLTLNFRIDVGKIIEKIKRRSKKRKHKT